MRSMATTSGAGSGTRSGPAKAPETAKPRAPMPDNRTPSAGASMRCADRSWSISPRWSLSPGSRFTCTGLSAGPGGYPAELPRPGCPGCTRPTRSSRSCWRPGRRGFSGSAGPGLVGHRPWSCWRRYGSARWCPSHTVLRDGHQGPLRRGRAFCCQLSRAADGCAEEPCGAARSRLFEPWFLIQGLLLLFAGRWFAHTAAGRRWWTLSLIAGVVLVDAFGIALAVAHQHFAMSLS